MISGNYSASLATTDAALTVPVPDAGTVGLQLSGTWTGTVTFEATVNGTDWVAIKGTPLASITGASTATVNGIFQFPISGMNQFRARFSTASSGTVVVTAQTCNSSVTKY